MARAGGMELIFGALEAHRMDPDLHENGWSAAWVLIKDEGARHLAEVLRMLTTRT